MARWSHKEIARRYEVLEDIVRRIYATVQTAKRQGLHGGYYADLVERSVGRKLRGAEYTISARAKEHLGYDPPGGYQGPKPRGSAKETPRAKYDDPKVERARQLVAGANRIIDNFIRFKLPRIPADLDILKYAADELDVAADLFEEGGAGVTAGTLRERARLARRGDYKLLETYE